MQAETIRNRNPESSSLFTSNNPHSCLERYISVRRFTELLSEPLEIEDYVVQTMQDVSPTKWHLAHVTWFFETFVLSKFAPGYKPFHPDFAYLFNSYYIQAGERHCRDKRGYLSRPTVKEVFDYRSYVDEQMQAFLEHVEEESWSEVAPIMEIGVNHEQQHQELLLTDIKHVLSVNPLRPAFYQVHRPVGKTLPPFEWVGFDSGLYEIGHDGNGFSYDNEGPRHLHYLNAFRLANRLVTNGEYMEFIEDGGYRRPELWLSMGWAVVGEKQWKEPFYWEPGGSRGQYRLFTLSGMQDVVPEDPVAHISYFEADAYARWAGARLPTEQEWEAATQNLPVEGHFVEDGYYHPLPPESDAVGSLYQMYGDVWEWTRSQYSPYPRYYPAAGALGEYNGKFMCNQFVLRGGSCVTSQTHIRATYRNFFPPEASWQFTGIRLARDPE